MMRTLLKIAFFAVVMVTTPASAQVTELLTIPSYLSADLRAELNAEKLQLRQRLAVLQAEAIKFNAACGKNISESSQFAKDCKKRVEVLEGERTDYDNDAKRFNSRVKFSISIALTRGDGSRPIDHIAPPQPVEDAANKSGMLPEHVKALVEFARDQRLLIIIRASNVSSIQHYKNPDFIAKPAEVYLTKNGSWTLDKTRSLAGLSISMKEFHTDREGDNAGKVVDNPRDPDTKQIVESRRAPIKIDGKFVHADYDLQGVYRIESSSKYKVEAGGTYKAAQNNETSKGDEKIEKVITDTREFLKTINDRITPNKPMFQHGDQDGFMQLDRKAIQFKPARPPNPDEKFLIVDERGSVRVVDQTVNLEKYYDLRDIRWRYRDDFR